MPLLRGSSRSTISANIARLIREGYPRSQAAAIAYRYARAFRRRNPGINPLLLASLGVAAALLLFSRTQKGAAIIGDVTEGGTKLVARVIDVTAPRGIRNNNPGNIVRTSDQWQGMSASQDADSHFVVFDAPVWGLRAMARILHGYIGAGADTVREIINRWAPPSENDTGAYVDAVAQSIGVDADAPVDASALVPLMQAITLHENGIQPYAVSMFNDAVSLEATA
jgi:hypothetical protein